MTASPRGNPAAFAASVDVAQCQFDGVDNAQIAGAPAEVATQLFADTVAACSRQTVHDVIRGREHAGSTEATLQRMALAEALADQIHDRVVGIALNGAHIRT